MNTAKLIQSPKMIKMNIIPNVIVKSYANYHNFNCYIGSPNHLTTVMSRALSGLNQCPTFTICHYIKHIRYVMTCFHFIKNL